jgi:hypothetical protein
MIAIALLIVFAALILLAGILLLIFGLVQSNPKLWIPGVIMIAAIKVIAILIIIVAFTAGFSEFRPYRHNYDYDISDALREDNYQEPAYIETDTLKNNYDTPVSGFIEDNDQNSFYLTVYPDKFMKQHGITILTVGMPTKEGIEKGVAITLTFTKTFKGKLMLQIFSSSDIEIGNNMLEVSQQAGNTAQFDFRIGSNIQLSDIGYCSLTAFQ